MQVDVVDVARRSLDNRLPLQMQRIGSITFKSGCPFVSGGPERAVVCRGICSCVRVLNEWPPNDVRLANISSC